MRLISKLHWMIYFYKRKGVYTRIVNYPEFFRKYMLFKAEASYNPAFQTEDLWRNYANAGTDRKVG